jgi:H+/Cl- antiporter ClcA
MSPSVTLGFLLGSVYGLLAHLFVGRAWRELPVYWLTGVAGFFVGFVAAVLFGVELVRLGTVPLVEATLGSLACLAVAAWLSRRGKTPESGPAGTRRAGSAGRAGAVAPQRRAAPGDGAAPRNAVQRGTTGRG